jgi:branched-chain amino acid transport system permease protein
VSRAHSYGRKNLIISILFAAVVFFLSIKFDPYNQGQLAVALMIFIGVLSIVLLTGTSGQISLGQGALMAVGGFAAALGILNLGLSIWLAIALAVIAALLAGLLLGIAAARLSGPYLAGTTLVIALAIPSLATRFESVFGGDVGLNIAFGNPPAWLISLMGEIGYEQWQLLATLPFATLALFFTSNILSSRTGRTWRAVRDHEIAASLAGVKISETKIFVFVISSGFAGLAGVLYGLRGIVGPSVYPISLSLLLLTGAVLGGIRSIVGALIGSILVVFLPDLIEWLMGLISPSEQVANYLPAMISSLLLILTVVLNPGGIAHGLHHKKRHR